MLIGSVFVACKKDDEPAVVVPSTGDLVVISKDIVGAAISNETVYLYTSLDNFNTGTFAKQEVTDNNGKVSFFNLTPQLYYVDCDYTNILGTTYTLEGNGNVSAGNVTTITIQP